MGGWGQGAPEMQQPGAATPLPSSHGRPPGMHTRTFQGLASKGGSRRLGMWLASSRQATWNKTLTNDPAF